MNRETVAGRQGKNRPTIGCLQLISSADTSSLQKTLIKKAVADATAGHAGSSATGAGGNPNNPSVRRRPFEMGVVINLATERAKRQPVDLWSAYVSFWFSFWRM